MYPHRKCRRCAVLLFVLLALVAGIAGAQSRPYTEGSVWGITMIRVKPGMLDVYLRELLPLRKQLMEEAKKQGLLLSTHILSGTAMGRDDFDLVILEEYKNWATFDGLADKFEAMQQRIVGNEEKQAQVMSKRVEVREIVGEKTMQELIPK